jgi:hypothetical protein
LLIGLHARVGHSSVRCGSREPTRNRVSEFSVFSSLLRMMSKYGFSVIREGLVKDLRGVYPTKWEDFETARILGEDIRAPCECGFKPVLGIENKVRVAICGVPSCVLASERRGTVLPRLALTSIRWAMTYAAQTIAFGIR